MRRRKIIYAALVIATISTMSVWKTYAASTSMPSGTVVIGNKAFDLGYANDPKNINEITAAIVAGGEVYVKGFDATWINNTTFKAISPSVIPSVTYKNSAGIESKFAAQDTIDEATTSLEVISIE